MTHAQRKATLYFVMEMNGASKEELDKFLDEGYYVPKEKEDEYFEWVRNRK